MPPVNTSPIHERILARVDQDPDGCWLWPGAVDGEGYGVIRTSRALDPRRPAVSVHRAVYKALVGPIPEGFDLHHRCEVRRCIRPDHLKPMTHVDHLHEHAADVCGRCGSTDWRPNGLCADGVTPKRRCGECNRRNQRDRRAA